MKILSLISILILTFGLNSRAQTIRYFEFKTNCGHGNWQDTTFIASATNQVLIDTVLSNLARPMSQRKFISGSIGYGNDGYNHNATHWFLWHFIPDEWNLTDLAAELCDGCPYTDVDSDTAYWVGTIGVFCPWTGFPVREIPNPLGADKQNLENEILIYPNPATDNLTIKWSSKKKLSASIFNSIGQRVSTHYLSEEDILIDVSFLKFGIYFIQISDGDRTRIEKLIINEN